MIIKIKNIFLTYSVLFLIGAITCFTAFNWKLMTNFQKLSLPIILTTMGLMTYLFFKEEKYKKLSLFFSCFMIGIIFATFGQVYQTGADSYTLFRAWAIFLILPIILNFSYSLFSLLITVLCLSLYFYLRLYYEFSESLYLTMLLLVKIILFYPLITRKFKFRFNEIFFNSLLIIFYVLFDFAGVISYFSTVWTEHGRITVPFTMGLQIFYPIILLLIYFISVKIYKKIIALPFTIISMGLFVWGLFGKILNYFVAYYDTVLYFLGSLIIFVGTLIILMKNTPAIENEFMKKITHYLGNVLKIFISLCAVGFVALLSKMFGLEKNIYLIMGIGLILYSFYLPKQLGFSEENKLEIFAFILGLSFCNYFLIEILGQAYISEHIIAFATGNILIYNFVLFFRSNKAMTLFFAPVHYSYIFIVLVKYFPMYQEKIYMNLIFIFGLVSIFLQLILENKNQNNILGTSKNRLDLIFYGNSIALVTISCLLISLYWSSDFFGKEYLDYLKGILIFLLSILVIIFMFKDKLKDKLLKKEAIKNVIILSVIIAGIEFFAPFIMLSRYLIFLILFYAYKKNKWTVSLLNIFLCCQIYRYYYYDTSTTLLVKSFNMFRIYGFLLFAYLIIKFFVKEFKQDDFLGKGVKQNEK